MSDRIVVTQLEQTCYACPSQWEGLTDGGKDVYIRFRWGYLSLRVNGEEIFDEQLSDSLDGVLSDSDMRHVLGEYCVFEV